MGGIAAARRPERMKRGGGGTGDINLCVCVLLCVRRIYRQEVGGGKRRLVNLFRLDLFKCRRNKKSRNKVFFYSFIFQEKNNNFEKAKKRALEIFSFIFKFLL